MVTTPDVDAAAVEKAAAGIGRAGTRRARRRPRRRRRAQIDEAVIEDDVDTDEEADALTAQAEGQLLGSDKDFWERVGIDPIRIMTNAAPTTPCAATTTTSRFLGRNGRISVFSSERSLARYLADEHESDLSDFEAYDDIRTAAIDGSLQIRVTDDNIYVLSGLSEDLADGPDAVDRDQLDLAVELARDVCDYAEDGTADKPLDTDQPLGRFVGYVLEPATLGAPPSRTRGRRAVGVAGALRRVALATRITSGGYSPSTPHVRSTAQTPSIGTLRCSFA